MTRSDDSGADRAGEGATFDLAAWVDTPEGAAACQALAQALDSRAARFSARGLPDIARENRVLVSLLRARILL
ncbi:MAG: hypothetical protein LCH62_13030 [Proteobacteria bacterium]|nr:hypothetical protein [Pseudomonadota bacterium]